MKIADSCGPSDTLASFQAPYGPKCDSRGKHVWRPIPTAETVERFLCSFGRGKRCNEPNCKEPPRYTAVAIVNGPGEHAASGTVVVLDACRLHHDKLSKRAERMALGRELKAWREA